VGCLLILCACVINGLIAVMSKKISGRMESLTLVFYLTFFNLLVNGTGQVISHSVIPTGIEMGMIVVGALFLLLGCVLYNRAFKYAPAN